MMEPTLSNVPDDLRYTKEHEYLARTGDAAVVRIGITDYAQGELGDVVFVNLPKVGDKVDGHQSFGTIEAVKAVSELYAPVAGEVVEVNASRTRLPPGPSRIARISVHGFQWIRQMPILERLR